MTFQYEKAKESGYTDEQILKYLSHKNPDFKTQEALEAGHSQNDVIKYLGQLPTKAQPKPEEPATLKGSASAYASGFGGGVGGIGGDILQLAGAAGKAAIFSPSLAAISKMGDLLGVKGTEELTKGFEKDLGAKPPANQLERILQESGKFGGQGALIGAAAGPVGAGVEAIHGSISGAAYGALKEAGLNDWSALALTAVFTASPIAFKELGTKIAKAMKSGKTFQQAVDSPKIKAEILNNLQHKPKEGAPPSKEIAEGLVGQREELPKSTYQTAQKIAAQIEKRTSELIAQEAEKAAAERIGIERSAAERATSEAEKEAAEKLQREAGVKENIAKQRQVIAEAEKEETKLNVENISPVNKSKPFGISLKIQEPVTVNALEGRVSEPLSPGSSVSKTAFESDAEAGREISSKIKQESASEKKIVDESYKEAREVTEPHNDTFAEYAAQNERLIEDLERIGKRNAGQEEVYKQAIAIRNLIGDKDGLRLANAQDLILQADAMSKASLYELPYVGYKGIIKKMVRGANDAVIQSLKRAGKPFEKVQKADRLYGRWADRFLGDEISPYLSRKILNEEDLYRAAVKNEGIYRAVKDALGSRKTPLMNKIDRGVTDSKMAKFSKDPSLIGSEQYIKSLKDLGQLIGKEKTAEVDYLLRKQKLEFDRKEAASKSFAELRESKRQAEEASKIKLAKRKEEAAAQEKEKVKKLGELRSKKKQAEKSVYKSEKALKESENISRKAEAQRSKRAKEHEKEIEAVNQKLDSVVNKISSQNLSEDEILSKLNSRSGIKELRKMAAERGISEKNIDVILKQKARSILTEGNLHKNFKGYELYDVLNNEKNYEILSEILGEEAVSDAYKLAKESGRKEELFSDITSLAKGTAAFFGANKFIKIIGSLLGSPAR